MDMINERLLLDVVNGNPGATAFALEVLTNYGPVGEFALTKILDADIKEISCICSGMTAATELLGMH